MLYKIKIKIYIKRLHFKRINDKITKATSHFIYMVRRLCQQVLKKLLQQQVRTETLLSAFIN